MSGWGVWGYVGCVCVCLLFILELHLTPKKEGGERYSMRFYLPGKVGTLRLRDFGVLRSTNTAVLLFVVLFTFSVKTGILSTTIVTNSV